MKLAEALIRRKALQENLEQLASRLKRIAKVQEGDTPAEPPQELLTALEADRQELQTLIVQINRANLRATLADGTTLMEAIVRRDILKLRRGDARRVGKQRLACAGLLHTDRTQVCPDGGCGRTPPGDRPTLQGLPGAGCHNPGGELDGRHGRAPIGGPTAHGHIQPESTTLLAV
jgi:hypothetical protein